MRDSLGVQTEILKRMESLPAELQEGASRRVATAAFFIAGGFLVYLAIDVLLAPLGGPPHPEDPFLTAAGAVLSLALGLLAVSGRIPEKALLDMALLYEVAVAFVISTAEAINQLGPGDPIWGNSWVCVLIVVFPMLVPHRSLPLILAALASATSGPIVFAVVALAEGHPASISDLINYYSSNFICFAITVAIIQYVTRMGHIYARARMLSGYRLLERIGRGGMGEVWLAEHAMLARRAAVKLIRPEILASGEREAKVRRRFLEEAQLTANLTSSHTVTLFDYGHTDDGLAYYVMELLDGFDLHGVIERFGPLPPERAGSLLSQVCLSLAEAHASGLVHRDVKPGNIFICRKGTELDFVKVVDFGLAQPFSVAADDSTATLSISGTPGYIAPEVVQGGDSTPGSDIYALGCVGYWLLTGRRVFERPSARRLIQAHLNESPGFPPRRTEDAVADELQRILLGCLAKDPEARPSSCLAIAKDLAALTWPRAWTPDRAQQWWAENGPGLEFTAPGPRSVKP